MPVKRETDPSPVVGYPNHKNVVVIAQDDRQGFRQWFRHEELIVNNQDFDHVDPQG